MAIGHIRKGAFHAWLGKKPGAPITDADIRRGLKAGGHAAKMANFARNARKFHHSGRKATPRHEAARRLYGGH